MKIIYLTLAIVFLILCCSPIFADNTRSTSSTTTTVTNPHDATEDSGSKTTQSTTYTTTTSTTSNSTDDDIVSAIYAKYAKDPALLGTTLTVNAENNIVTISGTVTTQSQADEASIAAKSVPGVKEVRPSINVLTHPNIHAPLNTPNY